MGSTIREVGSYGSVLADVVDSSVCGVVKGLPVPGFKEVLAIVQISDDVASFGLVGSVPGLWLFSNRGGKCGVREGESKKGAME